MSEMTEQRAREILGDAIQVGGGLYSGVEPFMSWHPVAKRITLDAAFTADELEAIAFWMRRNAT